MLTGNFTKLFFGYFLLFWIWTWTFINFLAHFDISNFYQRFHEKKKCFKLFNFFSDFLIPYIPNQPEKVWHQRQNLKGFCMIWMENSLIRLILKKCEVITLCWILGNWPKIWNNLLLFSLIIIPPKKKSLNFFGGKIQNDMMMMNRRIVVIMREFHTAPKS